MSDVEVVSGAPPIVPPSRIVPNSAWNNEALNTRFLELHKAGLSFAILAQMLNEEFGTTLSRNALIGKAGRLKLEGRRTTIHLPRVRGPNKERSSPRPRAQRTTPIVMAKLRPSFKCDPIELSKVNADARHLSLLDLEQTHHCHYPFGEGPPFTFCGLTALDGQPYCELHWALTHEPLRLRSSQ